MDSMAALCISYGNHSIRLLCSDELLFPAFDVLIEPVGGQDLPVLGSRIGQPPAWRLAVGLRTHHRMPGTP